MDFDDYAHRFREYAIANAKTEAYIETCLSYAKQLHNNACPIVYSSKHLAALVGYKFQYLNKAYYGIEKHYKRYEIPKKQGGRRLISEPLPSLKEIQRWILEHILYVHPVHPYAKAYVPGKRIRENIRFHRKQKIVLTLDIHDFFGSITQQDVFDLFYAWGYSKELSQMFSHLLCLDGVLPQGAPTSPHISNLFMKHYDEGIAVFCKKHSVRYTRYADDMTFSGDFNPQYVIDYVKQTLPVNLRLNESKTKIMYSNQRQIVTGCVVNEKIQLPKEERKEIRKQVYYIWKYGLESHLAQIGETRHNYLKHLLGRVNYAASLCPMDKSLQCYRRYLFELYKKETGAIYSVEITQGAWGRMFTE